jgi:hypothetical protein
MPVAKAAMSNQLGEASNLRRAVVGNLISSADSDVRSQFQQDSQARDRMAGESPAAFTLFAKRQNPHKSVVAEFRKLRPISLAIGLVLLGTCFIAYYSLKVRTAA